LLFISTRSCNLFTKMDHYFIRTSIFLFNNKIHMTLLKILVLLAILKRTLAASAPVTWTSSSYFVAGIFSHN
jgi:hypothetical protein